ncbi:MAG: hypothetical protein H6738_10160 [Alphaproteobacteria bacterium]|nr:hypothetical protein [Alphaproteobacteria bacterium]
MADWRAAWAAVRADDRSSDAIAAVVRAVGDPLLTDVPFRPWLASQEGPDVTDALLRGLATAEGPRALALVELLAPRVDADALAAAILARLDPEDPDPVLLWELRRSVDASACASFGWRVDGGVHPEALIDAWRTELAAHPGRPHPTSLLPSTFHCEP